VVILQANTAFNIVDLMAAHQLTASKGEGKRLIEGGGIKLDGEKVPDQTFAVTLNNGQETILQIGKRKYAKLIGQ
jgi:tyrosyl-tRNA synthetase